jgi:FMN-dependent oxidoreductase (nitrilotriacetate monooxygenase family)
MQRMRLAFILSVSPSPHCVGGWRDARSYRGFDWASADYWEHVARVLERGRFDMAFFADSLQLHDEYEGSAETAIRYGVMTPRMDPFAYVPLMARVTQGLGFGVTSSTSYIEPFYFARKMGTLDHLTAGRMAWNIVASYGRTEAKVFGLDGQRPHEDRYARADEFAGLCYRLWESWAPDAIVADRGSGIFADPAKVSRFQHDAEYFKSQGPLSVPRSPQGRPVIVQAGASPEGLKFAARHAEVHFAVRGSAAGMKSHMQNLERALTEVGRPRDRVKVLWSTSLFVGGTEADARRKQAEALERVPLEAGLAMLAGMLGTDLHTIPLDEPVRNIDPATIQGVRGLLTSIASDFGPDLTLRDAARHHGAGMSGLRITGDPQQVADKMEEFLESGGGDGFMLRPTTHPGSITDFVELVVPVLQTRGRVQSAYRGRTLRENLTAE